MELSILLFQKIVSMAIMILMGFAIVKSGLIKKGQTGVVSTLTLYVIMPCMIVSAFQLEYNPDRLLGLLIAMVGAVGLHLVYIPITKLIGDKFGLDGVERASLIYSNGGNLIIPLVSSIIGGEFVFYCCSFIAFQTVLVWTHLPKLVSPKAGMNLKKIILNPCIIAIIVGMICFFCNLTFPPIIGGAIDSVGGAIVPVAMLMIGMLMAEVDFKSVFGSIRCYLIVIGRLIVYPLLIILLIWASRITFLVPNAKEILVVTILATSAPCAASVTQIADVFGGDSKKASAINVMSVIFCIVTMPLIMMVYQFIC